MSQGLNVFWLGSARSLRLRLGEDGLIKGIVSYVEPETEFEVKVEEELLINNQSRFNGLKLVKGPICQPTTTLIGEGFVTENWVEGLGAESPFPILKGMFSYFAEFTSEESDVIRTIRAIPGVEIGTLAVEVTFESQLDNLVWKLSVLENSGIHILVKYGENAIKGFKFSFNIPKGKSTFKFYIISTPRKSIIDRKLMVLIPKKGFNEKINLTICALALLNSVARQKWAPIISYEDGEIVKGLEGYCVARFIRRILPEKVIVSLIGLEEKQAKNVKSQFKDLFEQFAGINVCFLTSEMEALSLANKLWGLSRNLNPERTIDTVLKQLRRIAKERHNVQEAVLIDAFSPKGELNELLRILAYGYAAITGARLFELSSNYQIKQQILEQVKVIDILIKLSEYRRLTTDEYKTLSEAFKKLGYNEEFSKSMKSFQVEFVLSASCKLVNKWLDIFRSELLKNVNKLFEKNEKINVLNDLKGSSIKVITVFAHPDIPYELSFTNSDIFKENSESKKAVGFIPTDAADKVLLSCLIVGEKSVSPVPTIVFFDPQVRIDKNHSNILWQEVNKLNKKGGLSLRLEREAATPYAMINLLNWFNCDVFVALTHGIYGKERGLLCYSTHKKKSRYISESIVNKLLSPEGHTLFVIIACGGWHTLAKAISSGMRGAITTRWRVLAPKAVNISVMLLRAIEKGSSIGEALVKAKCARKVSTVLSKLCREAFFLVGLPSLSLKLYNAENVKRQDPITISEVLADLIVSMRINEDYPREVKTDMLAAIWAIKNIVLERMDEVRFPPKRIGMNVGEELYTVLLVEMGNACIEAFPANAKRYYVNAIASKNNHEVAWNNFGYILSELGVPNLAVLNHACSITSKNNLEGAWNNFGYILFRLGVPNLGVLNHACSITSKNNLEVAWNNFGNILSELGVPNLGVLNYACSIASKNNFEDAWCALFAALSFLSLEASLKALAGINLFFPKRVDDKLILSSISYGIAKLASITLAEDQNRRVPELIYRLVSELPPHSLTRLRLGLIASLIEDVIEFKAKKPLKPLNPLIEEAKEAVDNGDIYNALQKILSALEGSRAALEDELNNAGLVHTATFLKLEGAF